MGARMLTEGERRQLTNDIRFLRQHGVAVPRPPGRKRVDRLVYRQNVERLADRVCERVIAFEEADERRWENMLRELYV